MTITITNHNGFTRITYADSGNSGEASVSIAPFASIRELSLDVSRGGVTVNTNLTPTAARTVISTLTAALAEIER